MLPGAARRIACFATSAHSATPVVAYAESGGLDPKIHVHQVDTLELVTTLDGGAHLGITALAFSRDGRCIAVASAAPDPTLSLIETRTGEVLVTFGLRSEATTVAFDPFDSNRVLATHVSGGVLAVHPGVTLHLVTWLSFVAVHGPFHIFRGPERTLAGPIMGPIMGPLFYSKIL